MGTEGFVNLVNMHDSSSSDRTMSIQRPSCFFNLCSSCSSLSNKRRRDCLLPPPRGRLCCRAGHPSNHPHILLFSGDVSLTPQPTSHRSFSPQRGHPLRWLRRLWVVLFLGPALVHRVCALGAARSTWSTNNSHRKRLTVGAHTGKCLLITRKIMISPPDSWDPPEGSLYFAKKTFPPLSARTHRKCLLITHKKMNTRPTS